MNHASFRVWVAVVALGPADIRCFRANAVIVLAPPVEPEAALVV
jgi:hypothetical protein